ncbi:hypothetical protein VTO42DRAFT_3008 [Malbranchea cinnamomea]
MSKELSQASAGQARSQLRMAKFRSPRLCRVPRSYFVRPPLGPDNQTRIVAGLDTVLFFAGLSSDSFSTEFSFGFSVKLLRKSHESSRGRRSVIRPLVSRCCSFLSLILKLIKTCRQGSVACQRIQDRTSMYLIPVRDRGKADVPRFSTWSPP